MKAKVKEITTEERMTLWHDDATIYEICAEVRLPCNWWEIKDKTRVLWAKKWHWMSGAGCEGTIPFEAVPPAYQEQLLIDVVGKARLAFPHIKQQIV